VPEFGIVGLDAIGLALAGGDRVMAGVIDDSPVERKSIGVVLAGLGAAFDHILPGIHRPLSDDMSAKNAPGVLISLHDKVRPIFYAWRRRRTRRVQRSRPGQRAAEADREAHRRGP